MKVNDLFESEQNLKPYVWRNDRFNSSWEEIKLPLKSVDDMKDIKPMEDRIKQYLGFYPWSNPNDYEVKLSDFKVTARSDTKDDYIKFSVVAKVIYNKDPKSPKNSKDVYHFTLSHDD